MSRRPSSNASSSSANGDMMPMLPSAAAKKQQQQNADIIASLEEALETAEQERDLNLERAQQNEQRVGELEAQRDATAADVEQQFATMQERFKTREA